MSGVRGLMFNAISALLEKFDYEVKLRDAPVRGFSNFLSFAERCGIQPRTVFDVGVGRGTDWLYDAFPAAKIVLFEPLELFRPHLESIAATRDADFIVTALGTKPGRVTMRVPRISPTGASLLPRDPLFEQLEVESRRVTEDELCDVDVIELDSIAHRWSPPYVLKIDVEGAELDVLRGARQVLKSTDLVLMEMSVLPRFAGEATFADRIRFMDEMGFRLFDIPVLSQTSAHGPLSFIDAAFVRKSSKLRLPRAW